MNTTEILRALLLGSPTLLVPSLVCAAPYYWDIDGATAGAGGTAPGGTWITAGTTWSTNVNGTVATPGVTTSLLDDLLFSAGVNATASYSITLNDTKRPRASPSKTVPLPSAELAA